MVDVRLLYPAEKTEAAARLEDALEAAGYGVERKALADAFPDLAAEGRGARVLLLIWSRGLVSAAMAEGGLGEARRRPNLVEVSVDGIEPTLGAEVSPVVLLSGWRGQPFHLGWQRILSEIERLCGSRVGSGRKAQEARSIAAPGPARGASKPARPIIRAAFAAGALIAATLGATAVLDRGAPDSSRPAATRAAAVATAASPGSGSSPRQEAAPVAAGTALAAPAGPFTVGEAPAAAAPAPSGASERTTSADPPARRPAAEPRSGGSRRLASASEPEVKRYSRKHSKTMRLFCQRSGRSTPQCRSFARSMRALRG